MTLVFIFWGRYEGFTNVLACAKARAGCPIWVISDGPAPAGVHHLPLLGFPIARIIRPLFEPHVGTWATHSLSRWYVLRDFIASGMVKPPIFCADWDVMIFRNLPAAYAPFRDFDYTVSRHGGMESAAYGINRAEPLEAFCDLTAGFASAGGEDAKRLNDMEAWARNSRTGRWKVGDLFQIVSKTVFDHNMASGKNDYEFDGDAKRVQFVEGYPFFTLRTGELIAANTMHCWGPYKGRTSEMREKAGIPL